MPISSGPFMQSEINAATVNVSSSASDVNTFGAATITIGSATFAMPTGTVTVTATIENPVTVAGNLQFSGSVTAINNSVQAIGAVSPNTATLIAGIDDLGNVAAAHIDTNGFLGVYVSGGITVNPSTGTQQVTGTVHIDNVSLTVSQSNLPATQSVYVVNSQGSDVQITGSTVTLAVSQTNPVLTASISNFPVTQTVTGTVHVDNATLTVSQSNLPATQSVTGTVHVDNTALQVSQTGSWAVTGTVTTVASAPVVVSQGLGTDGSRLWAVSLVNPVTSASASPNVWDAVIPLYGIQVNAAVSTGSVAGISIPDGRLTGLRVDLQGRQYVTLTGTTVSVSQTNPVLTASVSVSNFPATQTVTGTVHVDNPVTVVAVSNFSATQTVTGTVHLDNATLTVSQSNLPATQSVYVVNSTSGSSEVNITASITLPVSMTNPVTTASISNFPATQAVTGTVHFDNTSINIEQTASLQVTGTMTVNNTVTVAAPQGNPVWITGTITSVAAASGTFVAVEASVGTTGAIAPNSATQVAGLDPTGNLRPFKVLQDGTQVITGSVYVVNSQGSDVNITSSIPLAVTSSFDDPVWITGTIANEFIYNQVSGVISGTGQQVTLPIGFGVGVAAEVQGTFSGTIRWEMSYDGGNTWHRVETYNPDASAESIQSSARVTGVYVPYDVAGATHFRGNCTSWTSGTASIHIGTNQTPPNVMKYAGEAGLVMGEYGVGIMGADEGGIARLVRVASDGKMYVGGNEVLTDVFNNPTASILAGAFNMVYDRDGDVWVRAGKGDLDADNDPVDNFGLTKTEAYVKVFNGSTFDRLRGDTGGVYVKTNGVDALVVTSSNGSPVLVKVSGGMTASISNLPATQSVTGTVHFDNTAIAVSQTSSWTVTGTVQVVTTGALTVSQSNPVLTPAVTQTGSWVVTGTVHLDNTSLAVSQSNPVLTSSVTQTGSWVVTGSVQVTTTGTLTVSQSNVPAGTGTITGTVHFDNTSLQVAQTASWVVTGAVQVSTTGALTVSQSNPVLTSSVTQTGSWVVTGSVSVANTLTVSQSNPVLTASVTQTGSWIVTGSVSVANSLTVSQSNPVLTSSVTQTGSWVVTGSVSVANTVAVSQSNPVLTASVTQTGSWIVTGSVSVANSLTVSQSNPVLTSSVTQTGSWVVTGSVSITTTGTLTVSQSNPVTTVTQSIPGLGTSTVTMVGSTVVSTTIQASNSGRKQLSVFNGATSALYLKLGAGAATSSYTILLQPNAYFELPVANGVYTGIVTGLWDINPAGSASVTEVTV